MKPTALPVLALLAACGVGQPPVTGSAIGWTLQQPLSALGTVSFEPVDAAGVLRGTLALSRPSPSRAPLRIAVLWQQPGTMKPAVAMTVGPPLEAGAPWSGTFPTPPEAVRGARLTPSCEGTFAYGVLVAFADLDGDGELFVSTDGAGLRDRVLGASAVDPGLFEPHGAANGVGYESCFLEPQAPLPLSLFDDARLDLVACDAAAPGVETACGRSVFPRTVVGSAEAGFDGAQPFLSLSVLSTRPGQQPEVRVNGSLAQQPGSLLHPGANAVVVTDGALPPWEAQVVLPEPGLGLEVSANLQVGARFELRWRSDAWAREHTLRIAQTHGGVYSPQGSPFSTEMPLVGGTTTTMTLIATSGVAPTFGTVTVSQALSVHVAPQ